MTSIIGVLCSDGVVMGTDSAATFGSPGRPTIEQLVEKLTVIRNRVIVAGTGAVGHGQRFCDVVEKVWDKNQGFPKASALQVARELSRAGVEDLQYTHARWGFFAALSAFPVNNSFHLCQFGIDDFQPELMSQQIPYCSMGCVAQITDAFLALMKEVYWTDGLPSVLDAVNVVTWTLDHAIKVNPGGVNYPLRLAVLSVDKQNQPKARILEDAELGEPREFIERAKDQLRRALRLRLESSGIPEPPEVPG